MEYETKEEYIARLRGYLRRLYNMIYRIKLRKCIAKGMAPGPDTFYWKGKHWNKEKYLNLRTRLLSSEAFDIDMLNERLENLEQKPGDIIYELEIIAINNAIAFKKSASTADETKDGK